MKYTLTIDDSAIHRLIILKMSTAYIPSKYANEIFDCFVAQKFLQESGISMCLPDDFFVNRCCPITGSFELSFLISSSKFDAIAEYSGSIPEYRIEVVKNGDDVVYSKKVIES